MLVSLANTRVKLYMFFFKILILYLAASRVFSNLHVCGDMTLLDVAIIFLTVCISQESFHLG